MKKVGGYRRILKWIFNMAFLTLIVFEELNHFRVLNFPLDFTWIGLLIVAIFAFTLINIISFWVEKSGGHLNVAVWPLALVMVCIDAFGDMFRLYSRLAWYDRAAHFFGGLTIAAITFAVLKARRKDESVSNYDLLFVLSFTALAGSFYEIEEYLEDLFTFSHRLGDGFDTVDDIIMNLSGGLFFLVVFILIRQLLKYRIKTISKTDS